jgi:hypothetical protein
MTPGRKRALHLVLLAVLAVLVFLVNHRFVGGSSIASPDALSWDLIGRDHPPVQWIDDWMWHQDAPYKFRILGKLPVWAAWRLFFSGQGSQGFLVSFTFWGLAWLIATLLAFYSYLEVLAAEIPWKPGGHTPPRHPGAAEGNPSGVLPLLGCLFFLASPPILFAFKFPVHMTPNDLLGYFLTVLGLTALLKGRTLQVCGIACLAAWCRETTLIVPVAYVLTTRDPWKRRLLLTSLPFLCWVVPRVIWWTPYNAAGGRSLQLLGSPGVARLPVSGLRAALVDARTRSCGSSQAGGERLEVGCSRLCLAGSGAVRSLGRRDRPLDHGSLRACS